MPKLTEKQILSGVRSGQYRDSYLVYNRKSTDEPDNQKNSLKYQREENLRFAERSELPVASLTLSSFCTNGVIAERHSGFKEDNDIAITKAGMVQYRISRPRFKQLVEVLSKGYFKGVICLCWDRMSRNKADDALIAKLMRSGVDVRFAYAHYDKTSAGALHMDIDGMFAAHHSRVTSEKVRLATRNLRERGVCTYKAPIGYLNPGSSDHKPFDPERAKIVRRMFELYAERDMSLADIARWANDQGLTTPPMRRPRTAAQMLSDDEDAPKALKISFPIAKTYVQRILSNPFYIGMIRGNQGAYVKSVSHRPLVSKKVFYAVQEKFGAKRKSVSQDRRLDLPFRGLVRCAGCGRTFTPYTAKGHPYLMVHCSAGCTNRLKNCSVKVLEQRIGDALAGLILSETEHQELDERASTDIALLEQKRRKVLQDNERQKNKVRGDLQYLRENKLSLLKTGVYTPDALLAEENQLNTKLTKLQEQEQTSDVSMGELMKDVLILSELLKSAHLRYVLGDSCLKAKFAELLFSELRLSENIFSFSCKSGFKALETRFVSLGGQECPFSELSGTSEVRKCVAGLRKLMGSTSGGLARAN